MLYNDPTVAALKVLGSDGVVQLCSDIHERGTNAGFPGVPRPIGSYGASLAFSTQPRIQEALRSAYAVSLDLVYGESAPSFDECIAVIRDRAGH